MRFVRDIVLTKLITATVKFHKEIERPAVYTVYMCRSILGSMEAVQQPSDGSDTESPSCFQMFPRGLMSLNKGYKRQWKAWWFASSAPITISSVPGCPKSLSISLVDFPTNLSKDNFF